jgi:hypothetical protein
MDHRLAWRTVTIMEKKQLKSLQQAMAALQIQQ